MNFWLLAEIIDGESCHSCGRVIKAGEKAFIRVWWPYKEAPSQDIPGARCEDCKKKTSV